MHRNNTKEMKARVHQQDEVVASLYSNLSKVSHHLRHIELPQRFTPERFQTLAAIHTQGPISITKLAEAVDVRPATVSRMVSSLEDDSLIRRTLVRDDKRSVLISTTSKGRQMYLRASRRYLKRLGEAIAALEPEQVELMNELAKLLEKLGAALER